MTMSDFVSLNTAGFPVNIQGVVAELFVYALVRVSAKAYSCPWA